MRHFAVVSGFLFLCGCGSTAPADSPTEVDGLWHLTGYGTLSVPANVSELPVSIDDPTPSGCFLRLTDGDLTLTAATDAFRYRYEFHNSCTGVLLSSRDVSGTYEQSGAVLRLFVPGPQGVESFSGEVTGGTIVLVRAGDPALRFDRPGAAP